MTTDGTSGDVTTGVTTGTTTREVVTGNIHDPVLHTDSKNLRII